MRLRRRLCIIACCVGAPALVLAAACGGGSSNKPQDDSAVPTATLPASLPEPLLLGNGVVQASGAATYIIKSGDTLAGIASRFGVSLDDLRAANPGINAGDLSVGATVKLPAGTSADATPGAPPPTDTPAAPEPTDTPEPPRPADTATPEPAAPVDTPAATGQTYTVQAGDIPVTIAQKFGITVEALLAANPGLDPRNMHAGDVINIPAAPPA